MSTLDGKVSVVVGSGSGIGKATAKELARRGSSVVVADINEQNAKSVAAEIEQAGLRAVSAHVDVRAEDSVASLMSFAVAEFGALHILHNNAAALAYEVFSHDELIHEMRCDIWDETMLVNLRGAMLGCKHAIPHLISAGGGSIINTSSIHGSRGHVRSAAYGASKAGIESLTRSVAHMYGSSRIRCNAIAPGMALTEVILGRRTDAEIESLARHQSLPERGTPEFQARVVAFLASSDSEFITGQTITVDGGLIGHMPESDYGAPKA